MTGTTEADGIRNNLHRGSERELEEEAKMNEQPWGKGEMRVTKGLQLRIWKSPPKGMAKEAPVGISSSDRGKGRSDEPQALFWATPLPSWCRTQTRKSGRVIFSSPGHTRLRKGVIRYRAASHITGEQATGRGTSQGGRSHYEKRKSGRQAATVNLRGE